MFNLEQPYRIQLLLSDLPASDRRKVWREAIKATGPGHWATLGAPFAVCAAFFVAFAAFFRYPHGWIWSVAIGGACPECGAPI